MLTGRIGLIACKLTPPVDNMAQDVCQAHIRFHNLGTYGVKGIFDMNGEPLHDGKPIFLFPSDDDWPFINLIESPSSRFEEAQHGCSHGHL